MEGTGPAPPPPVTRPPVPVGGLTEAEAALRHASGLGNVVEHHSSRTYWDILRQNAYPAINGVLLSVSVLLVLWGLYVEAVVTAGPVLLIIVVGVVQEGRAKRALDRIALLSRPRAAVMRDGAERWVDPSELVVGDLIVARRGDEVVLDGVIVGGGRAELDESLLTGESDPVSREVGERVWSGSAVVAGAILYEATAAGTESLAGRILAEARGGADTRRTPIQREIAVMIWAVAGLVALAALPVVLGASSSGPEETLGAAAVLVSLVPQGLAIMVTFTYAAGALRVSRMGALVQRQNAIESISRVTVLCMDKTGTLTSPRVTLAGVRGLRGAVAAPLLLGTLAASTTTPTRATQALGDTHPGERVPLAEEVAFSSERRWSAMRFAETGPGLAGVGVTPGAVYLLGAPSELMPAAPDVADAVREATARGERVLLLARAPDHASLRDDAQRPRPPRQLQPLALLGFVEEMRADAGDTVRAFRDAGVEVKVISGDDPATVAALARRVGLAPGTAPAGPDLEALDEADLEAATNAAVFGRVGPALKARIVDALRRRGAYVAMVGDGVNDILSLRRAHLGIAMESGASATRGVADIVLLADRFGVLPRAVVEGRRIVAAMAAVLLLLLTRTFAMVVLLAATAASNLPVPITPRQNSILAFLAVGAPLLLAALLVTPRRPPPSLLRETLRISVPVGVTLGALALAAFAVALDGGLPLAEARTAVTTLLTLCGLGLIPALLGASRGAGRWTLPVAAAMLLAYAAVLALPPLRVLFGLVLLPGPVLGLLLGVAAVWSLSVAAVVRRGGGTSTTRNSQPPVEAALVE